MDFFRRMYRRGPPAPAEPGEVVEALLGGGSVDAFLAFAAAADSDSDSGGGATRGARLIAELTTAVNDSRKTKQVVRMLARDSREAPPDDRDEELGTAQAYHPFAAWLIRQPETEAVKAFIRAVLSLVEQEDQASIYYAAESALAAITDAAHQKDRHEVVLSMAQDFLTVIYERLLDGVHLREDDFMGGADEYEYDDTYEDDMDGGGGEPPQLSSIAEAVLMLINSRTPSNHWFLYPGWNPGTLVFVMERLFGLYGDDLEIEHRHLNFLVEKMISLLHGEHNLRAHVAGNAACALSQLCRTKGGMARVLTHQKADSMSEAIGRLLAVENLPPNNYTSRIVTKWVGNLAESEEGAPWLFARPLEIKTEILSSLVKLLSSDDFQTATEASHAIAQLLLYSEPDTVEGDAQRSFLYNLATSASLPGSLAGLMDAGGDPVQNDGPLESGHGERYMRGYAAAEEACVVVAEMIYDKEGSELLIKSAQELVNAVYGLLSSRDPDCAIAGANVLSRMADLSNTWGEYLQPTESAVSALTALLAHQSAHRHALPALSKVLGVKGWLQGLLGHEQFAVLVAWLVSELDPQDNQVSHSEGTSSSSSNDAEASWAAGTLATIASGSSEGATALLDGPHGEEMVTRLLALLKRRDARHAAAAALGPLQAVSTDVRERLLTDVQGRADGVSLALLESGGVEPTALDGQLKGLELAEKRTWMSTRLHHLHHPPAAFVSANAFDGPVELVCLRDQLVQNMCAEHSKGQGLAADLKNGVSIKFTGETGQGTAIRREWFSLTARELLNPEINLFVSRNAGTSYQPAATAAVSCDDPEQYMEVAGRVIGLAMLHAVPLDCRFTRGFLRQLLEQEVQLEDMEEMDPEVYKHKVRYLLDNTYEEYLALDFTDCVDDTGVFTRSDAEVELIPGGSEVMVIEENKAEYALAVVRWRMYGAIQTYIEAFKRGLHAVVPAELLLRMSDFVSPEELSGMIAGLRDIDLEDWKANTRYEGESMSGQDSEQARWFWEVMEGFSAEERRAVMQFATASPNVPVGGFSRLQSATGTLHPFTLSELTGRAATNTLPRAAACFNTLYLPVFESQKQMRKRIKVAVGMGKDHFDENAVVIGRGNPDEAQVSASAEENQAAHGPSSSPADMSQSSSEAWQQTAQAGAEVSSGAMILETDQDNAGGVAEEEGDTAESMSTS